MPARSPLPSASTSVLIAGGGPAGLALAIELGLRNVPVVLVDPIRPKSTADLLALREIHSPRAKLMNIRSMEHARRWGVAQTLRRTAPLPADYPANILFVTRLSGYTLAKFERVFAFDDEQRDFGAEGPLQCPQFAVEGVLRDFAATLPSVRLCYGYRLESFEQDDVGIHARLKHSDGQTCGVSAEYLAGCDGSRSVVRDVSAIPMEGEHALGHSIGMVFRAPDLLKRAGIEAGWQYWTINADAAGIIGPFDGRNVWWGVVAGQGLDASTISSNDAIALLRKQAGFDFEPEIMDLTPWSPHRLLAARFRAGRAFLVGDAAHLHPPFGGHGMNLGIGDAVDLGWKVAAVLQGWAAPSLLASYETERRPLARRVIDDAVANFRTLSHALVRPELEADSAQGRSDMRAEIVAG